MKKFIAILLVVLVAGVMFGDPAPGETLILQSTMGGKTKHGFYSGTALANFGSILSATFTDTTKSGLNMETNDDQPVGYYSFGTNVKTKVNVTLKASPLIGPGTTNVPYTLVATKLNGTVGETPVTIDLENAVGTTSIDSVSGSLLTQTAGTNGPKWATYSLEVKFNGTANLVYGLPETAEGDIYTGTVVALITTI